MNSERLRALIEAYGAWPDRWPEAERDEAIVALAGLPEADADLRAAQALDTVLDAWRMDAPTETFLRDIEARAMAQRPMQAPRSPRLSSGLRPPRLQPLRLRRPALAWLSSAGLAAACAAGIIAGVRLADLGPARPNDVESAAGILDGGTAFGAPVDLEKSG
jgi:hypothetical protein